MEFWQNVNDFFPEARVVLLHPGTFPERLHLGAKNLFIKGTVFVTLAAGMVYLLCIPVFMHHDIAIIKTFMMPLHIMTLYVFGLALHLGLKAMGSRRVGIKETIGLYGYVMGVQTVGFLLLMYPSFLTYKEVTLAVLSAQVPTEMMAPRGYVLNYLVALIISLIWLIMAMMPMFARYNHLAKWGKTRVGGAFLLATIVTWPFFFWVPPWLYKVCKFF
ncbi:MAG: hypothetical protein ACYC6G_03415 [Desulfobaccales bacterium]